MTRKFWTKEEDNLVIEKFPHVNTIEIAKVLNRSYGSVATRANFLQLKKTDEFMKSDLSGRNNNLSNLGISTRFKKGLIPQNKGKKVSIETYQKLQKTFFKKGNIPHTAYARDGVITTRIDNKGRPYKYIRVSLGKWKLLHKYNFENRFGKIPSNCCLWFKDGNSLNCDEQNIELITRAENVKRNRKKFLELPDDIISTSKLINKLNKKIKNAESNNSPGRLNFNRYNESFVKRC